jgi:arylsulfatase A-like enzyme
MKSNLLLFSCTSFIGLTGSYCTNIKTESTKPNIIIVFTDDQGYQDLGCYGSPLIKTPNIDQMAKGGVRFTDFYVSASISSPSRASLLTGRMPARNGAGQVFFPDSKGMDSSEITIAEVLKTVGYKTACFGKWHLGDFAPNMPLGQGFDEYFGIPYSNDMYIGTRQEFADDATFRDGYTVEKAKADQEFIQKNGNNRNRIKEHGIKELVPLIRGNEIVEYPAEQGTLTRRYFDHALDFISNSGDSPFFIYITPAMPHIPLFASGEFVGTSARGLYGDVVEEIDRNMGRLFKYLKENGLDENTMVIFTSDNGPWLEHGDHAGSALPFRDGKFTEYEGGLREPCIMRWPGKWASGKVSGEIVSTLDFLPTIAFYAGAKLPETELDGINIAKLLEDPASNSGHEVFFYSKNTKIWGVRKGDWKYLPHGGAREATENDPPELYNLKEDISETTNLVKQYPAIVKNLQQEIDNYNAKLPNKNTNE